MAWQPVEGSSTLEYDDAPADPGVEGRNRAAWQAQVNGFRTISGGKKRYFRTRQKSS